MPLTATPKTTPNNGPVKIRVLANRVMASVLYPLFRVRKITRNFNPLDFGHRICSCYVLFQAKTSWPEEEKQMTTLFKEFAALAAVVAATYAGMLIG